MGGLSWAWSIVEAGDARPVNRIERLRQKLTAGEHLASDDRWGYLPAMLEQLEISPDSQALVFSKTSFQQHQISPERPRAIYFNDDCYVAWVRDSPTIEFAVADGDEGARFYTLTDPKQTAVDSVHVSPVLVENKTRCTDCHQNAATGGVPGFFVRSIICSPEGRFVRGAPTYATDHTSPFAERWGGWYVTGEHGAARHLGNVVCHDPERIEWVDCEQGANQRHLPAAIMPEAYLRQTSDIFALMILAHETQMHNHLTRLARAARDMERGAGDDQSPAAKAAVTRAAAEKRFHRVVEAFMRYLLFADEPPLASPLSSDSPYRHGFQQRGPRDRQGRSLRDFDGTQYLFMHPCSFLIYGETFAALPELAQVAVGRRLRELLLDQVDLREGGQPWPRPTPAERVTVAEILAETVPVFWQRYVAEKQNGSPVVPVAAEREASRGSSRTSVGRSRQRDP